MQADVIEENVRLYDCMTHSEKQFIIEVGSTIFLWFCVHVNSIPLLPQVKELTCDKFKSRCKLKKLPREKAIVEHLHLVLNDCTWFFFIGGDP